MIFRMRHLVSSFLLFLLFYFCYGLRDVYPIDGHAKNSSCEMGSCYPATGNLLIGREKMLSATSTCGLHGKERYCIVSHLEPKKCFTCDSRPGKENDPLLSHGIENIVYSKFPKTNKSSWWQSENGKENVSIRLDLEAEFHFTHLIMKFRTFRPRAMLIERSSDKGKTWKVYRYFAENCDEAFPNVPKAPQRLLTDVICESRYSTAEPSNLGEVILRVISPSLQGAYRDPYSPQLQDLLKMTNLRINFTKLQTLGDDLVDNREEIKEKYYYAVKEMTVRGSCWCYGHARSCIPVEGVEDRTYMVHGKCNCTHNTKGLNCEECADAFNDVPWAPAIGRQANACRACNCNNHSNKCKFNEEVYIKSGRVSGGVCINCTHNTKGKNCEECSDSYYLAPNKDISEYDACIPCECNLDGSKDGGLCDPKTDIANGLEAGRCHCKANVHGKFCDLCKPGYWNFDPNNPDGCKECTCDTRGTVDGSNVCDVFTGTCQCKENVTGGNCNQCLPEHWGLSINSNGCEPCECMIGGSLYSDCDVVNGECKCRPNIVGRRCDKPNHGFYVPTPNIYEAEFASCASGDCRIEIREPLRDNQVTPWTGPGFMRVYDNTALEFAVNNVKKTNQYDIIIRYEPMPGDYTTAEVVLIRPDDVDYNDICANNRPQDDRSTIDLPSDLTYTESQTVCLEADKAYKIRITFRTDGNNQVDSPTASILIDSVVLVPSIESLPFFKDNYAGEMRKHEYERLECKESLYSPTKDSYDPNCSKYHYSIGVTIFDGAYECKCDPTGSLSSLCNSEGGQCNCKPNVVGRKCDSCAPGTYGFGPQGCKVCDCDPVGACNNICNVGSGQCLCKNGTYGRTCGECEPGQWNFPQCQPCECNGHAHVCNSFTGECTDCQDSTSGHSCERCKEGFYGDPKIGSGIQCKPCQCPNTIESGHSFAPTCTLDLDTQDVVCHCKEGYAGPRCDTCDNNFFGSPEEPNGLCDPCMCNDNIDLSQPGNCDRQTGMCLKCLHNTSGDHCEKCQPGFYGDALEKTCESCGCDFLGTNFSVGACDPVTGQCPCLPNVEGRTCSHCEPNFWKIGLGVGCESCNCDKKGSSSEFCNPYDGECKCRDGFGGRQCNRCKAFFFGDPNVECFPCECNKEGSLNLKCNQDDGVCECKEGIGGDHCDKCDRGWFGTFPSCTKCGECFYNWDSIINGLRNKTSDVIKAAGKIKQTGATGAYNTEFKAMTDKISYVKNILNSAKENSVSLDHLNKSVSEFRTLLNSALGRLNSHSEKVHNVLSSISDAKYSLKSVHKKIVELKDTAKQLNDNATQLQEKDLKGALNLTRAAGSTSNEVSKIEMNTKKLLHEVDRNCRRTEKFLNQENDTFSDTEQKNERRREELEFHLSKLEIQIPDLNYKICDGVTSITEHCDAFCGGAGCSRCGGISCKYGAIGKASAGLEFAKDTEKNINKHIKEAEKTFRMIEQARSETENANKAAKNAHNEAFQIKSDYESLVANISAVASDIEEYVKTPTADPSDIQRIAAEVLNASIPYEPDKIRNLTKHINDKIASLKNINKIVDETKDDQARVNDYKRRAETKMSDAAEVENKAEKLVHGVKTTLDHQDNVKNVIKQANESIKVIKKDLAQISSEISDAEQKANDTQLEVQKLQSKLKKLQTGVLKNEHDANSASEAGKRVSDQVKVASSEAEELIDKYNKVNGDLENKTYIYEASKTRAQQLFDKAQMLSGSAKAKLKELKDYTMLYEDQEKLLTMFAQDIKDLLDKMKESTADINIKSDKYRNCNN